MGWGVSLLCLERPPFLYFYLPLFSFVLDPNTTAGIFQKFHSLVLFPESTPGSRPPFRGLRYRVRWGEGSWNLKEQGGAKYRRESTGPHWDAPEPMMVSTAAVGHCGPSCLMWIHLFNAHKSPFWWHNSPLPHPHPHPGHFTEKKTRPRA